MTVGHRTQCKELMVVRKLSVKAGRPAVPRILHFIYVPVYFTVELTMLACNACSNS